MKTYQPLYFKLSTTYTYICKNKYTSVKKYKEYKNIRFYLIIKHLTLFQLEARRVFQCFKSINQDKCTNINKSLP